MNLEEGLLHLEVQFWKGDADFYRQHLTAEALMVFAEPVGILKKDQTVEAIAASPRWTAIHLSEVHVLQLTGEAALVIYKATAHRDGAVPD